MRDAWFLLFGLGWAMTPLPVGGQPPDAWSPADFRAGVALHGPPPLPYQGLRLRVWVENLTNQPLGPLPPVEDRCHVLVRGPRDADYRLVVDALPLPTPPAGDPVEGRRANLRRPRRLEPRGGQYVSFPVVASWSRGEGGAGTRPVARPVFAEPGTYRLKWVYREPEQGRSAGVEATLVVEVAEVKGREAEALAWLRHEETLLSAVLHPETEPTADEARRLVSGDR